MLIGFANVEAGIVSDFTDSKEANIALVVQATRHWLEQTAMSLLKQGDYHAVQAAADILAKFEVQIANKYGKEKVVLDPKDPGNYLTAEEKVELSVNIIQCIKAVRARTGCGLKDAKDLVEYYRFKIGGDNGQYYTPKPDILSQFKMVEA